jgi:hypothetical protein
MKNNENALQSDEIHHNTLEYITGHLNTLLITIRYHTWQKSNTLLYVTLRYNTAHYIAVGIHFNIFHFNIIFHAIETVAKKYNRTYVCMYICTQVRIYVCTCRMCVCTLYIYMYQYTWCVCTWYVCMCVMNDWNTEKWFIFASRCVCMYGMLIGCDMFYHLSCFFLVRYFLFCSVTTRQTCLRTYVYIRLNMSTYVYIRLCPSTCIRLHTYVHIHTSTYIHQHTCIYIYTSTIHLHTYIYIRTSTLHYITSPCKLHYFTLHTYIYNTSTHTYIHTLHTYINTHTST